jgi:hypothetical protein
LVPKSVENLRDTCPADAEKPSQRGTAVELACVEQRLVVVGESKPIAGRLTAFALLLHAWDLVFPGIEFDCWKST